MAAIATITMWLAVLVLAAGLIWWLVFSTKSTVASEVEEFADYVELRGRPAERPETKVKQRQDARKIIWYGVEVAWWSLSPLVIRVLTVWAVALLLIATSFALQSPGLALADMPARAVDVATSLALQTIDALTLNIFSFAGIGAVQFNFPPALKLAAYLLTILTGLALARVASEIVSLLLFIVLAWLMPRSLASRLRGSQKKRDLLQRIVSKDSNIRRV